MFDSNKTENELLNLSALIGSIKTNAEKINGDENAQSFIEGITQMCEIAEGKLSAVRKDVLENSEVKKMFDCEKTENDIMQLFGLITAIRTLAENIDGEAQTEAIMNLSDIAKEKLSNVWGNVSEISNEPKRK